MPGPLLCSPSNSCSAALVSRLSAACLSLCNLGVTVACIDMSLGVSVCMHVCDSLLVTIFATSLYMPLFHGSVIC